MRRTSGNIRDEPSSARVMLKGWIIQSVPEIASEVIAGHVFSPLAEEIRRYGRVIDKPLALAEGLGRHRQPRSNNQTPMFGCELFQYS